MAIDPARLDLVRDSFRRIRGNLQPPSAMFYDALFQHAPGLRGLFRDDLEGQGMRFMTTLAVIVDDLDRPEALERQLSAIGRSHAALGVRPAHFAPMEEALIDTLRAQLGAALDADAEAAWRDAYGEVSRRILAAAGSA